ncbi:acetyl-CoA carboxylase biotin carboxylase subunit [Actinomadura fibrosa]|uniref:biotin carboxylase n=1 Tax=Actinomadura fibrosa TaxID=111802 RepID=A0ABW2XQW2_9ACTN|nr:acetyl-CoA carboxylase biotin carboxylase subunit [Actinomadura fibrosa]
MFGTVLIANRGEIALRVARTCREMGVRTVAVYSTADAGTPVVRFADEAVCIGPADPHRSYLYPPAIIEAALRAGADAIHPGYGFLSEDPDFAEICEDSGIAFVGPPAQVIARLADKAVARTLMATAGLPLLPGSDGTVDDPSRARDVAAAIGYPVIIKAAAGGGGRGMCVVSSPADLAPAYEESRAQARAAFGDSRVYLERYLRRARHIEVQVLCDRHGNAVHLGERDCSVQRRHQKLVEESPAPGLPDGVRRALHAAAVRGALATGYIGAGTFEFLVDEDGRFTFMEINQRIQVEHPVTEMVTGVDIVREQLLVAAGRPLRLRQDDVAFRGAAVECRLNAEDPDRDFRPAPGTVERLTLPGGPFTRVDTHIVPGERITSHYDPLIAKIVTWDEDRDLALDRMDRALYETEVAGPGLHTTGPFLRTVLADPRFRAGAHHTDLVERMSASAEPVPTAGH